MRHCSKYLFKIFIILTQIFAIIFIRDIINHRGLISHVFKIFLYLSTGKVYVSADIV